MYKGQVLNGRRLKPADWIVCQPVLTAEPAALVGLCLVVPPTPCASCAASEWLQSKEFENKLFQRFCFMCKGSREEVSMHR